MNIKLSCILLGDRCASVVQSSLPFDRWSLVGPAHLLIFLSLSSYGERGGSPRLFWCRASRSCRTAVVEHSTWHRCQKREVRLSFQAELRRGKGGKRREEKRREEKERLKGLDGKAPSQEALQEGALPFLPRLLNSRGLGLFGLVDVPMEERAVSGQVAESPAWAQPRKPGFESVKSHPGEWQ